MTEQDGNGDLEKQTDHISLNKEQQSTRTIEITNDKGLVRLMTHEMEKRPDVFKNALQEIVCIICLALAPACATMSMGAYTTALPDTISKLNISQSVSTWLVGSISLANGATLLIMGSLADSIGRKNCVILGFSGYAVFTLIGGFMNSLVPLCIFRALSGVLNSLALTSSYGIVGSTYVQDSKRKNRYNAIISTGNPLGTVVGNFCGAICVQFVGSWRDTHYFFAILYGALTGLAWYSVPRDKNFDLRSLVRVLRELDYVGAFLSLAGFTLICFSITQASITEKKWHTPYIIALLIVGIVLVIALFVWEAKIPKKPLIPMQIWKNRDFTICAIITSFNAAAFTGVLIYYPVIYFQEIEDNSPILAAVKLLPMFVSGILTNFVASFVLHKISGRMLMILACTTFVVGSIIWATTDLNRAYFLGPFWGLWIVIVGADLQFNVTSLVTYSSVSKELQSSGAGLLNMFNRIAGAIGLAISSSIISASDHDYGTTAQYDDLNKLWDSFRNAYYFAIGASAVGLCTSLFLRVGKFKKSGK